MRNSQEMPTGEAEGEGVVPAVEKTPSLESLGRGEYIVAHNRGNSKQREAEKQKVKGLLAEAELLAAGKQKAPVESVATKEAPASTTPPPAKKGFFSRLWSRFRPHKKVEAAPVATTSSKKEEVAYSPENVAAATTFSTDLMKILHVPDEGHDEIMSMPKIEQEITRLIGRTDFGAQDPAKFELVKSRILFRTLQSRETWREVKPHLLKILAERGYLTYTQKDGVYTYRIEGREESF